ncbi:magnesium-transporting ATPase (P-type) [Alkalicoccobacillus murimartini]|uniref:Magnesium-transporting ATPase (P-type) n=2 Tax=Alkalicoccobacillus murimartini TaxID=171685 RepID=A0ABT9YP87_9BACI|nr:magnesium-transporting ATPase (P-type) [Alkalicoccobacillus murimartini]
MAVLLIGSPVLALCLFGVPRIASSDTSILGPELSFWRIPLIIGLYLTAFAFFVALYQAIKLLGLIDKNEAFSELSVRALTVIMTCAVIISIFYVAVLPLLYAVAEIEDAPGIIVIGLVILFASTVIAVFAAVLKKLFKHAIEIKSENDLTV